VAISRCATALLVTASTLRAAPAPGVTFTKIADTSTLIPAGHWAGTAFQNLGGFDQNMPAICGGVVVFVGAGAGASGNNALFRASARDRIDRGPVDATTQRRCIVLAHQLPIVARRRRGI